MQHTYIGIDNGWGGAWCMMTEDENCYEWSKFDNNIWSLQHLLDGDHYRAIIEKPAEVPVKRQDGSQPRPALKAVKSTWECFGYWKGFFAALDIPLREVTPHQWAKFLITTVPKERNARKKKIADAIKQRFPEVAPDLRYKTDWDIADATGIALWGLRNWEN